MPIAHGGLRHLREQRLRVTQQQVLHGPTANEFLLEALATQLVSMARTLHHCAVRRRFTTHEERDANDAFVADYRDLSGGAVRQHVQE